MGLWAAGALMAVPAHDQRDFGVCEKIWQLPIKASDISLKDG